MADRDTVDRSILHIGSWRELFVDRFLIERLNGARLELHRPTPAEIALAADGPEDMFEGAYPTVLKDGETYRMYYRGSPNLHKHDEQSDVTCYAESCDGINWQRPSLGLYEINGTRDNNVIIPPGPRAPGHNFTPFLDTRPGVPDTERYKALAGSFVGIDTNDPRDGFNAYVSADGIRWTLLTDDFVIDPSHYAVHADHSSVPAFWSDSAGCYVAYLRIRVDANRQPLTSHDARSIRWIGRTTSGDFLRWSRVEIVDTGDVPLENLYTNQTQPYFRAPHICLAFPFRFNEGETVMSVSEFDRHGVPAGQRWGVSDGVFMTSRGGATFDRTFMRAFLSPGLDRANWSARNNIAACGILPTGPEELSLYYLQHTSQPTRHLRRYTLRTDGFASVRAPYQGGELLTKLFTFEGRGLEINYATSAFGSVRVEIQDITGEAIPGFTLADAKAIVGDEISRVVSWQDATGMDVSSLAGRPIRLRFVMRDADLYALRFRP